MRLTLLPNHNQSTIILKIVFDSRTKEKSNLFVKDNEKDNEKDLPKKQNSEISFWTFSGIRNFWSFVISFDERQRNNRWHRRAKKLKYVLIETAESDYFRYNKLNFELRMFKSEFYQFKNYWVKMEGFSWILWKHIWLLLTKCLCLLCFYLSGKLAKLT